ncbi:hypothetical protein BDE02_15G050200 [Populus trichocarpa]|nr:hypothetical protein BDE02_15G050200 [Populus trichocarpa]
MNPNQNALLYIEYAILARSSGFSPFLSRCGLKPIFRGNVFSSLIHSVARNPSLAKQLFGYAILGFALTEAIALFALMMGFFFILF